MTRAIAYADFQPGAVMGEHVESYDLRHAQGWQRIFGAAEADGANGPAEAASIAVVLMMRAYLAVVTPRPPGNVHARQKFTLQTPPRPGEAVRTVVSCVSKELRRDRRYVDLQVRGTGDGGRALYTGRLSLVWAA